MQWLKAKMFYICIIYCKIHCKFKQKEAIPIKEKPAYMPGQVNSSDFELTMQKCRQNEQGQIKI